jgi:hypothetical protein
MILFIYLLFIALSFYIKFILIDLSFKNNEN